MRKVNIMPHPYPLRGIIGSFRIAVLRTGLYSADVGKGSCKSVGIFEPFLAFLLEKALSRRRGDIFYRLSPSVTVREEAAEGGDA